MTSDGTTLLGADNKAGIAEILAAVRYLIQHPELAQEEATVLLNLCDFDPEKLAGHERLVRRLAEEAATAYPVPRRKWTSSRRTAT